MATKHEIQRCIEIISALAVENYKNSKVLPSLVIAQSCWESGYLTSELAKNANNPFGLKYNKDICNWSYTYKGTKWCNFDGLREAVVAQGKLYNMYDRYSGIIGETNIDKVLAELEKSGYCEGSGYSDSIRKMINNYNLLEYDSLVLKNNNTLNDSIDVKNDFEYQKALNVFIKKGIITQNDWLFTISTKHTQALICKTCKYLYNTSDYNDGITKLKNAGVLTSDIWNKQKDIKAIHLRSFIIKVSKLL